MISFDDRELSRLAAPAARIFSKLARAWDLTHAEQLKVLNLQDYETIARWNSGDVSDLSRDVLERLSHLLNIFRLINMLLPAPDQANAWVRKSNAARLFAGRTALDLMMTGRIEDVAAVRNYLEAQLR